MKRFATRILIVTCIIGVLRFLAILETIKVEHSGDHISSVDLILYHAALTMDRVLQYLLCDILWVRWSRIPFAPLAAIALNALCWAVPLVVIPHMILKLKARKAAAL